MNKIISFGSTKESSLYFDQVFPCDHVPNLLYEVGKTGRFAHLRDLCLPPDPYEASNIIKSLLPRTSNAEKLVMEVRKEENNSVRSQMLVHPTVEAVMKDKTADRDKIELSISLDFHSVSGKNWNTSHNKRRLDLLKSAGFESCPWWILEDFSNKNGSISEEGHFAVTISSLNLVDPKSVGWDAIIEFRKDTKSRRALKALRAFFHEEFQGKPVNYISDKLSQILYEQELAVKLWGFETAQKSLSVAFTNKSLLAAGMSGLATTVTGMPLPAAAVATIAVPLAGASLEFAKIAIDQLKNSSSNPLKYLTTLKKLK